MSNTPTKPTKDFIDEVIQYCLDHDVDIKYHQKNEDGSKNLTTKRECDRAADLKQHPRHVCAETVYRLIEDDILPKTQYVIEQTRNGTNILFTELEKWITVCKILQCDITFEESQTIHSILANHNASLPDPQSKTNSNRYELICSDGYSIERTIYNSKQDAIAAMKQAFNELESNCIGDDYDEMSYCNETDAMLYDRGENVYIWNVMTYGD